MEPIFFRTEGGFCNRVRGIISAILWAEDISRSLVIYWPVEPGHMPCAIQDIFDPIPGIQFRTGYLPGEKQVLTPEACKRELQTNNRICSYAEFHIDMIQRSERAHKVLKRLIIKKELEDIADQIWKNENKNAIGIHIRRTDHKNCITASPLTLFHQRIDPRESYCLVTDDPLVQMDFLKKYSNVFSPIQKKGRGRGEDQLWGVIDWLLLQKCSKIIASKGSSYSEIAAFRAQIPLEVLTLTQE